MFKVNAFALWLDKTTGKGKLAPTCARTGRQRGWRSGVAKYFLNSSLEQTSE
jgi:hypothetical protein